MNKIKPILLSFACLLSISAYGQNESLTTTQVIDGALLSIEKTQMKDHSMYLDGEWQVEMRSYLLPAILGVGRLFALPVEEPSAFISSAMAKVLHNIYELVPDSRLPVIAKKALDSTRHYKAGDSYAYYTPNINNGVQTRGPRDERYVPNYIKGLTHIPTDTDTTSVTYAAYLMWQPTFKVPEGTFTHLSKFRDTDRSPHYYNRFHGVKNSGAFMTWQIDEKDPKMPLSLFARPEKGERIPFSVNDVDCVVNGNALHFLTLAKRPDTPGYAEACQLVNQAVINQKQKNCAIYYPNSYAVFYTNSNAYSAGATCLEKSRNQTIQFILTTQSPDGSWRNEPGIGSTDRVQSTALAMNALLNYYGDSVKQDRAVMASLHAGARFLKKQAKCESNGQCAWSGEVFFSAVAQARNTVLWRSKAYTTALATLALVKTRSLGLTDQ